VKRSEISRGKGFKTPRTPLSRGAKKGRNDSRPGNSLLKKSAEAIRRQGEIKKKPYHPVKIKRGLVQALDAEVSTRVRTDNPACVLCGESDWQKLTCGHLFKRTYEATRFDYHEGGNCSTLCRLCNERDNRKHKIYVDWFKGRYGLEAYEALKARAKSNRSFECHELRAMLDELRAENGARKKAA
jgi:hypothetical protein